MKETNSDQPPLARLNYKRIAEKLQSVSDPSGLHFRSTVLQDPLAGLDLEEKTLDEGDSARQALKTQRDEMREQIRVQKIGHLLGKAEEARRDHEPYQKPGNKKRRMVGGSILCQLSDLHFGCTVKGIEAREQSNEFNFEIAAHRMAAYADQVIFYGLAHEAEECVIALTGDCFDSKIGKERYDKILNSEATACEAFSRGHDFVMQFVETIRHSEVFGSVRIVGISGNEARLFKERGHTHVMAADNWDALLNALLARRYDTSDDVACDFAVNRLVAEVQGWRVLLMHGDQGLDSNLSQTKVQSLLGTHRADFGISGHVHDTKITSKWCRSASLVGSDHYASDGLGLEGRAMQNCFWLAPGQRNCYSIDLQNPDPAVEPFGLVDYAGAFGVS